MSHIPFFNSEIFTWFILPLLIFIARIFDVAIGTIRVILLSKNMKFLAPLLGFFEVLIWLLAIGQIMQNLTNVACYIAYAGGFAMGNFVGICIENKLAMGMSIIRIITTKDAYKLINFLKSSGYGITSIDAQGVRGRVNIIYTIIKRKDTQNVVAIIKKFNPKAFFSIEDIQVVSEGIFPLRKPRHKRIYRSLFRLHRKGK